MTTAIHAALILAYLVGFVFTVIFTWKYTFAGTRPDDPIEAALVGYLSVLLGAVWPALLVVGPPVVGAFWGVGKLLMKITK